MRSDMPKAPRLTFLALLLLSMTLSACVTRISVNPIAPGCRRLVTASGLLMETPGAARPSNDTAGELAAFGDRQTGQLDKANADKHGVDAMLGECEQLQKEATANAQRKLKPWWQRIF